jgi:hypothetical protein
MNNKNRSYALLYCLFIILIRGRQNIIDGHPARLFLVRIQALKKFSSRGAYFKFLAVFPHGVYSDFVAGFHDKFNLLFLTAFRLLTTLNPSSNSIKAEFIRLDLTRTRQG